MKRVLILAVILNLFSAIFNAWLAETTLGSIVTIGSLLIACGAYYDLRRRKF